MANIFGTLNPKGIVGGSETSGCYLLENASSMTHLFGYTYEGDLQDIDNKSNFPLKYGDTLIGDDNYVYKLTSIDTDLGTFEAVQFWKLASTTPTIEIDFSQALSSDTYALDSDQFGLIQNNEVVKVDLYSESELLTFIKKSDDGSNIVMGTIITYDSTNSVYVYKEAVINVSSYEMTISDMTLSSGGGGSQLYEHNIKLATGSPDYVNANITIINDDDNPMGVVDIAKYLYDNGFTYTSPNYESKEATGTQRKNSKLYVITSISASNNSSFDLRMTYDNGNDFYNITISTTFTTFVDKVVAL